MPSSSIGALGRHGSMGLAVTFILLAQFLCLSLDSQTAALVSLLASLAGAVWLADGSRLGGMGTNGATGPLPDTRVEWFLLATILAFGAFLRFFRLASIPPGLFFDMGYDAYGALRILHEGWKPGLFVDGPNPEYTAEFYALAAWFSVFPSTLLGNASFFALASIIGLSVFYMTFRILSGPRVALVAVFLLSVMRWHINFSRNAFPNMFGLLVLSVCLLSLLEGLRTGKRVWFIVWGMSLGIGLWSYQSLKVIPLWMAVLWLGEWFRDREKTRLNTRNLFLGVGVAAFAAAPVISAWLRSGTLGRREARLALWNHWGEPGFPSFLWDHAVSYFLVLHRCGGTSPQHEIVGEPMLDAVMGFFFIVGTGLMFRSRGSREGTITLSGLIFLSLPGFLSDGAVNTNRILAVTPFIALVAARGWTGVWNWGKRECHTRWFRGLLLSSFAVMAALNISAYFGRWAKDPRVWSDFSVPETMAGTWAAIPSEGRALRVAGRFFHHFTFRFLAYDRLSECRALGPSDFLDPPTPGRSNVRYILDPEQTSIHRSLMTDLSGSRATTLRDPWGKPQVVVVDLSEDAWKGRKVEPSGFRAKFYERTDAGDRLILERVDRVVEYLNGNDFPKAAGAGLVWGRWSARWRSLRDDKYEMIIDSTNGMEVRLDGKIRAVEPGLRRIPVSLGAGKHSVELRAVCPPVWDAKVRWEIKPEGRMTDMSLGGHLVPD